MSQPPPDPETDRPVAPVWGAGQVVLRPGLPPVQLTLRRRIARFLGGILLVGVAAVLPFLGLAVMGLGHSGYEYEPAATPTPPTPTPTVEVTTVPVALNGSWLGRGYQTMGTEKTWTAKLNLLAGARAGRLELVELGCSGSVNPVSSDGVNVRLVITVDDDPAGRCAPRALLRLSSIDPGQLSFTWEDAQNPENRAIGILVKF